MTNMRRITQACLAVLLTLFAGAALADEIVKKDFTISNVTVRTISNGSLVYRAGANDVEVPLADIVVLNLENEPRLAEAMTAFNAGQMRSAERTLSEIYAQAQVPWVKQFVGFYLVQARDQRGEAVEAATVYVALASSGADPFLLSKPPIRSLAEASDNQKTRIRDQVMAVIAATDGETRTKLESYLRLVTGEENIPDLPPNEAQQQAAERGASAVILPDRIWKTLEGVDPRGRNADRWDAIKLLVAGKPEEAVAAIAPWMESPGELPDKLYVLGRAQLEVAEKTGDEDDYKDAGLTFMRLFVHFGPPAGQDHVLALPAQLELAYIHKKIGRVDLYDKLLDGAFLISVDAKAYPEYRKRYYQITGEEPPPIEPQEP